MRRVWIWLALLGISPSVSAVQMRIPVVRYSLKNGLRVVLSPDRSSPQVAVVLIYDVGSAKEVPRRSGFAHLFEHMMFQGSGHVKKGEHFRYIKKFGGTINANTTADRTLYYSVVPSSQLAMVLWLESDRMRSLKVTLRNLNNQRKVVKNERRQRIDNKAYIPAMLRLRELAYSDWAYAHPVIGSMADLDSASLSDVQRFFARYYRPNNAVLAISGDFKLADAKALIAHYFGDIARGAKRTPLRVKQPRQDKTKYLLLGDKKARLPAFMMAWHIPPSRSRDAYALSMLSEILVGGKSSRLYRLLVKQKQLVLGIFGGPAGRRGPDLFTVVGVTRGGAPKVVRALVRQEIARIQRTGITARELQKIRNNYLAGFIFGYQKNRPRAESLAKFELYYGDATLLNGELQRYLAVTTADIQRVAKTYFVNSNLTVIDVMPARGRR